MSEWVTDGFQMFWVVDSVVVADVDGIFVDVVVTYWLIVVVDIIVVVICWCCCDLSIFVKISSALPSPSEPSILYTPSTTLEIFSLCRRHHLVFQHSSLASTYNWLFVCTAINFITIMIIINTWHASWISRSHAFISWRSMVPFPSTSYIRNAQRNFSSAFPVNYHGCFGKLFNYFWTMPEIHKIKLFWNVKYQYLLK